MSDAPRSVKVGDRTVHGLSVHGNEIVRYDRAGKWYVENAQGRAHVGVGHAAQMVADGTFYPGKPGGRRFDSLVRKLRQARPE